MRGMEMKYTGVPLPPALLDFTEEQRAAVAETLEQWQARNLPIGELIYMFRNWAVQHG